MTFSDYSELIAHTNARWVYECDSNVFALNVLRELLARGWTVTVPDADLLPQYRSDAAEAAKARAKTKKSRQCHVVNDRLFCDLCGVNVVGCGSIYCGEGWRAEMQRKREVAP